MKNQEHKLKNRFKFRVNKKIAKKSCKNGVWDPPGSNLETFERRLGAVGPLLGAFLAFLASSGALLGCLLGVMGALDLILGGFGEGLGRILRGFGEGFAKVLEAFGRILIF